ncbi:hypothetical protein CEJ98_11665 [Burkholderia gladioli pv. gladioli]|nr:hypothetical protein CEJ98_11665 [Burkholderia gladioli pv. gladioli]
MWSDCIEFIDIFAKLVDIIFLADLDDDGATIIQMYNAITFDSRYIFRARRAENLISAITRTILSRSCHFNFSEKPLPFLFALFLWAKVVKYDAICCSATMLLHTYHFGNSGGRTEAPLSV